MRLFDLIWNLMPTNVIDVLFGIWWNRRFWEYDNLASAFIDNITGRGQWLLSIASGGESPAETEKYLRRHGVHVWGRHFSATGDIRFFVKREQANYAEYLLLRNGAEITGPAFNQRNYATATRRAVPTPGWGSGKRSLSADGIISFLLSFLTGR